MTLPVDSLIAYTLEKMQERIVQKGRQQDGKIQSGLLFTGNVHDAIPRRLLLDTRLSPLDKMAWMMIRLYAQNNEGAVFPTYDELQLQLASRGKEKPPGDCQPGAADAADHGLAESVQTGA